MRKSLVRRAAFFSLCLLPFALVGGYFAAKMSVSTLDQAMIDQAVAQVGSVEAALWITAAQAVVYALVLGFFGYMLAEKIGLMRPIRFDGRIVARVVIASVIGGAVFSLDQWTFGRWIPQVGASYENVGRFDAVVWLASVFYGGVIEEVMMRLFFMSLLSFLGWKLFFRGQAQPPKHVLILANVIAALLFAAGHLSATQMQFGELTPLILLRCFLLNGAFGLLFGRIYRRYGIQYAMLSHALFHVVSRTVWLLA